MTKPSNRIAVIGAGPAGLAAAYRLSRAGVSVVVFEARGRVGGRMRTDEIDGFRVDAGIQLFGSMYREFFRLLRQVEAEDRLVPALGRDALWRAGEVHEVVYGSVRSMLPSRALPLGTKLRVGATYIPFLLRHGDDLDLHRLERAVEVGLAHETAAAWGERVLGRDFVEYMAAPLLAAYYGVTPEETSAAIYHVLAHSAMDVEVFALRGGAASFCEALADEVRRGGGEVRLDSEVQGVTAGETGVQISGCNRREMFDAVVLAVPAPTARRLLGDAEEPMRRALDAIRYRPTVSLALLLDRPVGVGYFGLSLPRTDFSTVSTVCIEENKEAGLVPPGKGLLVAFAAPEASAGFIDAEPGRVLDAMLPELERVFPRLAGRVLRAKVYRWPEWHPVFGPEHFERLPSLAEIAVDATGRLALAGDYLVAPGVEGSVVSGLDAAGRIFRHAIFEPAIWGGAPASPAEARLSSGSGAADEAEPPSG